MKKITKLMLVILAVMAVACFGFTAFAEEDIAVYTNAQKLEFDVPPAIIEGRTMVPVRVIFEALGAEVEWEQETKTVTATRDELTIKLTIGDKAIYVGGEKKELDVPALIIDGRTLVPARAVSEAFGADVQWNAYYREVYITEYSESYKKLVSLIKEKGEKIYEDEECYQVEYNSPAEIVGNMGDAMGTELRFFVEYNEISSAPISLCLEYVGGYIFVVPDCTGNSFEFTIIISGDYVSGVSKCAAISRDEDCMIELDMGMDVPAELKPLADMFSNLGAYMSYSELAILQEWIESTGSDLTVEELGFVNFNKRIKPLAEGKDDKCDFCDKKADVIPVSITNIFGLVDIKLDDEYCVNHFDEKLIGAIDLDVVAKTGNLVMQLIQAQSEEPVKYVLATDENYVVINIVLEDEYVQMLEMAAKQEGFEDIGTVLEEAFFADESVGALAEELTAVKDVLAELNEYGVNISFDGIIINVCKEDGEVLADLKIDA